MTDRGAEYIRPYNIRSRLLLGGALGPLSEALPRSFLSKNHAKVAENAVKK
mgnify:CR=1 FL=1